MSFVAGYDKGVTWQPDGGAAITICITGWTVDDTGDLVEVTNTCSRRWQAFLAAINRGGVNVTAFFDSAQVPSTANIKFGVKGTIGVSTGAATAWSIHCIIEKVNYKSTVNGVVEYNFDVKADSLKTDGTYTDAITYPA